MERLPVNALMYALADKYEIDHLKNLAKAKFEHAATEELNAQTFAHAAELVSMTTPSSDPGLRSIVAKKLSQRRELIEHEDIAKLLDSGNGMAWSLVQVLLRDGVRPR